MIRVFRNIGWLLGSRAVNAVFSLIYLALATRVLGLEDFGRFALIVAIAQSVTGLASFNTWQTVVRWTAAGEQAAATGFALALDLTSIAVGSVIAFGVCWTAPLWLPLPPELRLVAFGLCLASLLAIRSTPTGLLRAFDRYDRASLAEAILPATRALGAILAAALMPTVLGFVMAWAAAELTCAAAYWLLARSFGPVRLRDVSLWRLPSREAGVWRFALATNFSRSLAVAGKQVMLLFVGALGGAAIAGGYRVAAQLGQALVQLGEAVSRAIYPELVRASHAAHELARRMSAIAFIAGLFAVGAAASAGPFIIAAIAGDEFVFATIALVLLAMAGALELVGASWEALLVARGRAETAFVIRAVPLAAAFCALPYAFAFWELAGIGGAVLFASLGTTCGFVYAALRLSRVSASHRVEGGRGS